MEAVMLQRTKNAVVRVLRWSERYTKTDMVYLARGGFWFALGQVVLTLVSLLLAIAFGHLASQDTYGNYKYALSLAGILGALSLTGLGTSITQSTAKGYEGALEQGFRLNMKSSVLLVIAALGGAVWSVIRGNAFVAAALVLVALSTPLLNSFSLYNAFLIGKRDFKRSTIYNIIDGAVPTLLILATLFVSKRAIILVLVYFLSNTLITGFFYYRSLRWKENGATDPELLSYSTHLSVMNIIGTVADKIDSIAIFALLGPAQLGIYSYAIAIPEQIKALIKMIAPLSMPKFATRTILEIRRSIWPRIVLLCLAVTCGIVLYIIIAPWIFAFLFPVYMASVPYSRLYALSILATVISTPLLSVLQAHKETRKLYVSNNISAVILIVTLPTFAYFWGIIGAIGSQLLYRFTTTLVVVWQFLIEKPVHPHGRDA